MAYEFLALDIDGTLVNSKKVISPKTKHAIIEIQKEGVKVVIASGRSTPGVLPLAREIELDRFGGYILAFNGGRIVNVQTGEIIYDCFLPADILPEIFQFAKEHKLGILTYENHTDCMLTEDKSDPYVIMDAEACHMDIHEVEDANAFIDFPLNKIILTGEPERLEILDAVAKEKFAGRLSVYRSEGFYLEFMPLGIDKAYGLSRLLQKMGYERHQLICCGDGFNDIPMITYAGLGVAMDNAHDDVKSVADYIAPGCDEDGLVTVIQKFLI